MHQIGRQRLLHMRGQLPKAEHVAALIRRENAPAAPDLPIAF
jgi:hypothetical protein